MGGICREPLSPSSISPTTAHRTVFHQQRCLSASNFLSLRIRASNGTPSASSAVTYVPGVVAAVTYSPSPQLTLPYPTVPVYDPH